jgi:HEAT repeat protein
MPLAGLGASPVDEKLRYVKIRPQAREDLMEAFASDDEDQICNAMYSAAQHEPDWRWTQTELIKLLSHKSLLVRSSAIAAIGEVAIFQRNLDPEVVLPELYKIADDPALAPFVEDCLDDIKRCIRVQ